MLIDDKQKLIENAFIECNLEKPGRKIISTPDWVQVITPSSKHPAANIVCRSILAPNEVEKRVKETVASYEALEVPFRWNITPLTEPRNTSKYLESNGMSVQYEAVGMMAPAKKLVQAIDKRIEIREAALNDLELYLSTFLQCWEFSLDKMDEFREDLVLRFNDKAKKFKGFIAYYEGEPVGTAGLILVPSGAYLTAGSVDKKYRGKGIYKALLSYRAKVVLNYGKENLLIHANKLTAAPICNRVGFESVCDQIVYGRE